jgi:hypothetical protein
VRFVQLFRMSLRATRDVRVTASMVDLSPDMFAQRYQHIGRRMELTFYRVLTAGRITGALHIDI